MPALNYKAQWAGKVADGTKPHTIRAKRKQPVKPGDTLYHYTGMRQKGCRLLRADVCTHVYDIVIRNRDLIEIDGNPVRHFGVLSDFANADGFAGMWNLVEFFEERGLPFHGDLICWQGEPEIAKRAGLSKFGDQTPRWVGNPDYNDCIGCGVQMRVMTDAQWCATCSGKKAARDARERKS